MSRSISIPKQYPLFTNTTRTDNVFKLQRTYDSPNVQVTKTDSASTMLLSKNLPPNIDIFSNLPNAVFDRDDVRDFLLDFRYVLLHGTMKDDLAYVDLSKLHVSEITDETVQLDWIYSYFRVYFFFDKSEGAFWGIIENDQINNEYENKFKKMEKKDYITIVDDLVSYVVMMSKR